MGPLWGAFNGIPASEGTFECKGDQARALASKLNHTLTSAPLTKPHFNQGDQARARPFAGGG